MANEYEGSVWPASSGLTGITISGLSIPKSLLNNGWRPYNHSKPEKTIFQLRKRLPNGRYDEIRLDNHYDKEGVHILVKRMLTLEEKPTKEQFFGKIAPELAKKTNEVLKKTKHQRK